MSINGPSIETLNVYYMVHVDRLPSIFESKFLYSDLKLQKMGIDVGTSIAYENIRQRRRAVPVVGYPDLTIGGCVPFYFGTHTPMLLRAKNGRALGYEYEGGQEPIVYLVFRVLELIREAEATGLRWLFTDGNAAALLTEQYFALERLSLLNWEVLHSSYWAGPRDEKQAEFLVESQVPLGAAFLGVGVETSAMQNKVNGMLRHFEVKKQAYVKADWYFKEGSHG